MSPLLDALLTADSEGYLKPAHVQTPQAKELVESGLATICPTTSDPLTGCAWERLTPAGMLAANILREMQTERDYYSRIVVTLRESITEERKVIDGLESRLAATWPKGDE